MYHTEKRIIYNITHMQEGQTQSLEQQIAELQKAVEEKRKQLEEQHAAGVIPELPHPKETVRETVREKIESISQIPSGTPSTPPPPPAPPVSSRTEKSDEWMRLPKMFERDVKPSYESPDIASQLEPFEQLVTTQGLDAAIKEVVGTQNAALIDAFHDWLVEKAYSMLIQKGELEAIQ